MNKKIFASQPTVAKNLTINAAGGKAYSTSAEAELAQLVVTGCLNNTFYATENEQLDRIKSLAEQCSDDFLAKCAVYARKTAGMKDTPALLLAVLVGRRNSFLTKKIFNNVINSQKMLRNFVQVVRSGQLGFKSFGTSTKNLIKEWLQKTEANKLFKDSVGQSPSLADVVKMVHPKPENKQKEAFYGWLLGKNFDKRNLPSELKVFEKLKEGKTTKIPEVDFRMLTALNLDTSKWTSIAEKMNWGALIMNLNTLQRHGVFENKEVCKAIASRLANPEEIRSSKTFPYQLMTAYQNTKDVPSQIRNALQSAMEIAIENVPSLNGNTVVLIDVSASMGIPVTGYRQGATAKTTYVDAASLIAASIIRKNNDSRVIVFDNSANEIKLNPMDSVMTNAKKIARNGGGTDCGVALKYLLDNNIECDNVIMVSDNMSWCSQNTSSFRFGQTGMGAYWKRILEKNKSAKLLCVDIQPTSTVQVMDSKSVLNFGGINDSIFTVMERFFNGSKENFVDVINKIKV